MNLYAPISVYRSAFDHAGWQLSLADFMRLGKERHAADITAYRTLKQSLAQISEEIEVLKAYGSNIEQKLAEQKAVSDRCDELKRSLPCATLSGLFAPTRAKANLVQHSGFICIDIDDHYYMKDFHGVKRTYVQSLDHIRETLSALPYVLYASHSVGGKGYFALIPLGELTAEHTHEWYFDCLRQEFELLGIVIDPACRDTTRLRFCSYDPDPYRNANAVPYQGLQSFISRNERRRQAEAEQRRAMQQRYQMQRAQEDPDADFRHVDQCISKMKLLHVNIADAYEDWVSVGMSLANAFGERGRPFFHDIAAQSTKYNFSDSDKAYSGFIGRSNGSSTLASLFNLFKQNNIFWYK